MIVRVDADAALPPYEQVREQITAMIVSGTLPPGRQLPPIRQLAADLDLAPGTVARAYRELEGEGLVVTRGRRGTTVAAHERWRDAFGREERERRLEEAAVAYVTTIRQLGVDLADAIAAVSRRLVESTTP